MDVPRFNHLRLHPFAECPANEPGTTARLGHDIRHHGRQLAEHHRPLFLVPDLRSRPRHARGMSAYSRACSGFWSTGGCCDGAASNLAWSCAIPGRNPVVDAPLRPLGSLVAGLARLRPRGTREEALQLPAAATAGLSGAFALIVSNPMFLEACSFEEHSVSAAGQANQGSTSG